MLKKRRLDIDAALIARHGGPGEDGTLQGLLDLIGLRYSGPGQAASALGMDKLAFGAAMAAAGLPTLPRAMVTTGEEPAPSFDGPFIVKPRFGGSSIGIEVAEDWPTVLALKRRSTFLDQGAVVEPFLTASRDLQVAAHLSQVGAVGHRGAGPGPRWDLFLRPEVSRLGGEVSAGRSCPPRSNPLEEEIRRLSVRVTEVAGLRGIARIDYLERDGEIVVNEVNTIPGSMGAYLWIDPPIGREQLFRDLMEEARSMPVRVFSVAGSDGTALRSAGTIASKLG